MITRSYYRLNSITGSIDILNIVNNKPTGYILYLSHDINGILIKKEFPTYEKAVSASMMHGCLREKWEIKSQILEN